jgi:hypothetical protein
MSLTIAPVEGGATEQGEEMKKIILVLLIVLAWPAMAFAWSLTLDPVPAGSEVPLFYYVVGAPAGTAATYTATLPAWFTVTGGVAVAPDSTGATGFKLPLPSTYTPPATGLPSLTVYACDGVACVDAPFGRPSLSGNVHLITP